MSIKATGKEWIAISVGLILIVLNGIVLGYIESANSVFLRNHSQYVRQRDVKWEAERRDFVSRIEVLQEKILKNQNVIIDHIKREEAKWTDQKTR